MIGSLSRIYDGLASFVAGLGDRTRDKSEMVQYVPTFLDDAQLATMYSGSWLPRKIVRLPAQDAVAKRRQWQATQDQIERIEAEEKRLNLWPKLQKAIELGRLWGGAALMIGDGSTDPSKPLLPETIKAGGIKYLSVITRRYLTAQDLDWDVGSPTWGEPLFYQVNRTGVGVSQMVHPSRLVVFRGDRLPDIDSPYAGMMGGAGWGQSVLQAVYTAVKNADTTSANISSLIFEANVDIFRIPGLWESMARDRSESKLLERFSLAATLKGNNRSILLDKDEEYDRKQISFASLPETLQVLLQICAGASDIPATRLLGVSPSGMNATGESDLNNYHDGIVSFQTNELEPAMRTLDACLLRSAAVADPSVFYLWSPLKQMTLKERADVGKVIADTAVVVSQGILTPAVMRSSTVNQLTELGIFPGLEADFEATPEDEFDLGEPEPDPQEGDAPTGTQATQDAAPRSLYVSRRVTNAAAILAWAEDQGITNLKDAAGLHVTVMYSRAPVDWIKAGNADEWGGEKNGGLTIAAGGPRLIERFDGGAIVLQFASRTLAWRHDDLKRIGAEPQHAEYQPHITLAIDDAALQDLRDVEPYTGAILLGPEIFEEVKD